MKPVICLVLCCLLVGYLQAQTPTLPITTDKTTSLVFPYPVRHVDRGTADVLVEPVKSARNILLIKAACAHFPETNLSVVTEDGSLYSFLVTYQPSPNLLTYELPARSTPPPVSNAARLMDNPRTLRGVRDHAGGMSATLAGIYIQGDTMYYQLCLENESPVDYQIDYLRFAIRDRKKGKREAIQEVELTPLHLSGNVKKIKAHSSETLVIALETFTIPDARFFVIEVGEKNGGRHLTLKMGNRTIIRAIPLPEGN